MRRVWGVKDDSKSIDQDTEELSKVVSVHGQKKVVAFDAKQT